MPHPLARGRDPKARAARLWLALLFATVVPGLMPAATQAATNAAPRPPASLPMGKPRIPLAKVPLPVPRPDTLDAEIEAEDAAEAESQAAEAPPAPATFAFPPFAALAPAPAFAAPPPPAPQVAEPAPPTAPPTAPSTAPLPRLANVPTPRPREPLPGEEDGEAADEDKPAPALVPPPPPSGSAASGAPAAGAPAEVVAPGTLPALCAALVEQQALVATPAPPVAIKPGCALPAPVQVTAVRLADGNLVTLSPAAILQCEMAAAVTQWVRDDLGPAVATLGTRMETFKVAASYDCRPRNRIKGAKMSEHGQGNAIDFGGFETADKRVMEVKNGGLPIALQERFKADACTRFSTVLGPGSDGYHEDHIHVDIAKRRLDIKLCRWIIKTPAPALIATRGAGKDATGKDAAGKDAAAAPEEEEAQEASPTASREPGDSRAATMPDKVPLPLKRPQIKTGPKAAGDSGKLPGG